MKKKALAVLLTASVIAGTMGGTATIVHADEEGKVIFGGRLGEYKYYDMDQVIATVLDKCEKEF